MTEGMEHQYGQRIGKLEQEVHGLGERMTGIEVQGHNTQASVEDLKQLIMKQQDKEPLLTPAVVMGMLCTVIIATATLLFGLVEYVDITQEPIETIQETQIKKMDKLDDRVRLLEIEK